VSKLRTVDPIEKGEGHVWHIGLASPDRRRLGGFRHDDLLSVRFKEACTGERIPGPNVGWIDPDGGRLFVQITPECSARLRAHRRYVVEVFLIRDGHAVPAATFGVPVRRVSQPISPGTNAP